MNNPTRRILQVALPLIVVLLGKLGMDQLAALKKAPTVTPPEVILPLVLTQVAVLGEVQLMVHAQGVVQPRTESVLVSEVQGKVIAMSENFRSGGFFEDQEVLLRLDDTDLRSLLAEAESRLATSELMLAQEEADAELSIRDWKSVNPSTPAPTLVARVPQLARVRADRAAARANLAKAQRDVERCQVRAPYPGRVRERMVDLGTYVSAGRELAMVYAIDFAEAHLPVPDSDLAALNLSLTGEKSEVQPLVTLEADFAGALQRWEGRILRTTGSIDPMSNMVMLIAEVEDPYRVARESDRPPLYSGLFVDAWIEGRTLSSAVSIPRDALQPDRKVFLLTPDSRLEIRKVKIAHSESDRIILESGLAAGEHIIVSPLETPVEGMRLQRSGAESDTDIEGEGKQQ